MINLVELKIRKRKRLSGLLGLSLDGSRLEGVVLRRSNGLLQALQSFSVSLSLRALGARMLPLFPAVNGQHFVRKPKRTIVR